MAALVPEHPGLQHPPEDMANSKGTPANAVPNDLPATNETARETGSVGVAYPIFGGDGPDKDFYTKCPAGGKEELNKMDLEKLAHDINRIGSGRLWDAPFDPRTEHQKLYDVLEEIRKWLHECLNGSYDEWIENWYWYWHEDHGDSIRAFVISEVGWEKMWSEISLRNIFVLLYVLGEHNAILVTQNFNKGLKADGVWCDGRNVSFNNPQLAGRWFGPFGRCFNLPPCNVYNRQFHSSNAMFGQPIYLQVTSPTASALEELRRTTAAATPNHPRAIVNSTSQSRPISSVKQHATTSPRTNAVSPNNRNQPRRSVNTANDVGPAVVAQTQASPSPLPRKDRPVQHVTTDGKSSLTQAQPSSSKSPRRNHARQSGPIAPMAAKHTPTRPRGPMTNGNGKPVGRHIPDKMGQIGPPMSHNGPPTQSSQTRKQGGLASNACVELPSKPRSDGRRAVSSGNAPNVNSTAYGDGGSMQGNGSSNGAFVQPAMYDRAFQAQPSHQLPAAAPGRNASPAGTTSTLRDGSSTRGGDKNKGRRGPQNHRPQAGYPVQGGKGSFYSQDSHQIDTARGGYGNNTYHYHNRDPDYEHREMMRHKRSVFAKFEERSNEHPEDIRSRLKSAMTGQFGKVENVFHASKKNGTVFIVLFECEDSAVKALQSTRFENREKGINIEIRRPYMKQCKKDPYVTGGGRPGTQQCQPYQNGPHFPMANGMPPPGNQQRQPYQNEPHSPMANGMPPPGNQQRQPYQNVPHFPMGNGMPPPGNQQGYNARSLHNLRPANPMMMRNVPHSLYRDFLGAGAYEPGTQARASRSSFPQPMMPQQAPPQSPQVFQIPRQEASKVIPKQDEEKTTKPAADQEAAKSLEWKAQSKPPSEEALENDDPFEKDRAITPTSQGSKSSQTSNRKVRVSLPSVSPPRLTQSTASKIEKPIKQPGKSPVGQEAPPKLRNSPDDVITPVQPSHTRKVPDEKSFEVPLAIIKGSETSATTTTAVTGTRSNLTAEQIKRRRAYSNMIAVPLSPSKVKKTTSTENDPANAIRDKAASSESLPSDTACHVPKPAQHIPDAETSSVKSDESKTMSASSLPSNCSPSSNPKKTPDNWKTAGSHSGYHSKVSKTPRSPVKKNAEASKNQKLTTQEENVVQRGSCFPSRADQDSFKFPGNGQETIRVRKVDKGETASIESSVQERGTTSRKRGCKTRPASRSVGFIDQNQQQESQPRVEVIRGTDSATRHEASASTTNHARQISTPRNTSPASVGGSNKVNLQNVSSDRDTGGGTGWQKVRSRRRASKRTNTPGSSDHQG
ncbi:hypothetical protein MAJ_02720, partial [Metarhizium majus ARSEF 297]